jgi:hypothetical protein
MEAFVIDSPLDIVNSTATLAINVSEAQDIPGYLVIRLTPADLPLLDLPVHHKSSILEREGVRNCPVAVGSRSHHAHAHKVIGG